MTTERDLIQSLTNALEVLHKEAVTAPYSQTLVIGGIAHPIPIGNDLLARDAIYADLLARAHAYLSQPEPEGPTVMEIIELADEIEAEELGQVDLVRRALARWGHLAIQPVPVSERLPGPEDCDAEGRCWWWDDDDDKWCLHEHSPRILCWTHWIPYYSLPVPTTTPETP